MGKKKLTLVGAEEKQDKKIVKSGKSQGKITDFGEIALQEMDEIAKKQEKDEKETENTKVGKKENKKESKKKGKRYLAALKKVKKDKEYSLIDSIKLAQETSITSFEGSIEAHFVLREEVKGKITFPHSTGKKIKAEIVTDETLENIKNGKIDFTVLIATPADMPKLARYAKILGPKGLMPNPKNGTITDDPKEALKKLSVSASFKSEQKTPLLHITVGKAKQSPQEIYDNLKALMKEINIAKILKLTLTSTMGPGIKVDLQTI